jgi:hypothetical protein
MLCLRKNCKNNRPSRRQSFPISTLSMPLIQGTNKFSHPRIASPTSPPPKPTYLQTRNNGKETYV